MPVFIYSFLKINKTIDKNNYAKKLKPKPIWWKAICKYTKRTCIN